MLTNKTKPDLTVIRNPRFSQKRNARKIEGDERRDVPFFLFIDNTATEPKRAA